MAGSCFRKKLVCAKNLGRLLFYFFFAISDLQRTAERPKWSFILGFFGETINFKFKSKGLIAALNQYIGWFQYSAKLAPSSDILCISRRVKL